MSLGLADLLLFVLVIFPGVLARAAAQRVVAIPADHVPRSWVREVADALSYSLFLAPIAASNALLLLWATTSWQIAPADLVAMGPEAVLTAAPAQSFFAIFVYALSAFVLAEFIGSARVGSRLRAELLGRMKLGEGLSDYPIWWSVMEGRHREYIKRNNWTNSEVFLNVHIAGGGRYTGVLLYFALAGDTEANRDFSLWKAQYYPPKGGEGIRLPPDNVVLLNSRDCTAIEVSYVDTASIVGIVASVQPPARSSGSGTVSEPPGE